MTQGWGGGSDLRDIICFFKLEKDLNRFHSTRVRVRHIIPPDIDGVDIYVHFYRLNYKSIFL